MAPYISFAISLVFLAAGLWVFLTTPGWFGIMALIAMFVIGALVGRLVFKRLATPEQVKADLEARLHND